MQPSDFCRSSSPPPQLNSIPSSPSSSQRSTSCPQISCDHRIGKPRTQSHDCDQPPAYVPEHAKALLPLRSDQALAHAIQSLNFSSGTNLNRGQDDVGEMRGQPGAVCSVEPVVRKIRSGDEALCGNRLYQGCRDQDQGGGRDPPPALRRCLSVPRSPLQPSPNVSRDRARGKPLMLTRPVLRSQSQIIDVSPGAIIWHGQRIICPWGPVGIIVTLRDGRDASDVGVSGADR